MDVNPAVGGLGERSPAATARPRALTPLRVAAALTVAAVLLATGCSSAKTGSPAAASLTVAVGSATLPVTISSCSEQVVGNQHTLVLAGTLQGGRTLSVSIPLGTNSLFSVVVAAVDYVGTSGSVTLGGSTYTPPGAGGSGATTGTINGVAACSGAGVITFNNLGFALGGAGTTTTAGGATTTTIAGRPSTSLTFTVGSATDGISSASVVCLQESVATLASKFFFDIVGTTTGGKSLVFSGTVSGYHGPGTYSAPPQGILFSYGGTPYAGVTSFRPESGGITVGGGGTSGSFASLTIPAANPNSSGQVTVNGSFACTSFTSST